MPLTRLVLESSGRQSLVWNRMREKSGFELRYIPRLYGVLLRRRLLSGISALYLFK
jgi:hypothetical protein